MRLLVYHYNSPIADQVQAYAQYLSDLLDSHPSDFQTGAAADATFDDLTEAVCGCDLGVITWGYEMDDVAIVRTSDVPGHFSLVKRDLVLSEKARSYGG